MKNLFKIETKNYKFDNVALNRFKVYKTIFGAILELPSTEISIGTQRKGISGKWYIESGTGEIWIKNESQELLSNLSPGKSLFIPSNLLYQIKNTSNIPLKILTFGDQYSIKSNELKKGEGYWDRYENTDEYKANAKDEELRNIMSSSQKLIDEMTKTRAVQNAILISILEDELQRPLLDEEKITPADIFVKLSEESKSKVGKLFLDQLNL